MGLQDFTSTELLDHHNKAAALLGEKPVKRFSTKKAAFDRTVAILRRFVQTKAKSVYEQLEAGKITIEEAVPQALKFLLQDNPQPVGKKIAAPNTYSTRTNFNRPLKDGRPVKTPKNMNSLRGRVLDLLKGNGATFPEICETVIKFDYDRGVTEPIDVTQRARECTILLNTYLNWGLEEHTDKDGEKVIVAFR